MKQISGRAITLQRQSHVLPLDTPAWQRIGIAVSALQSVFFGVRGETQPGIFLTGS